MRITHTFKRPSRLSRFQSRSRDRPERSAGRGTAWLIFDAGGDLFQYRCYWMGGPTGDHLVESARVATDIDAADWAAVRTPSARIRLPDHRTYWAGTAPAPRGFAGIWQPTRPEHHPAVESPAFESPWRVPEPSSLRDRQLVEAP